MPTNPTPAPTPRGQWPRCHHHPTTALDYGPHAAPLSSAAYWRCPDCAAADQATVQPFELTAKHTARPITAQGRVRPHAPTVGRTA